MHFSASVDSGNGTEDLRLCNFVCANSRVSHDAAHYDSSASFTYVFHAQPSNDNYSPMFQL